MTFFQGIFVGFLIGALAALFCVWLAGGSLYGDDENAPDDAGTSKPGQNK